MFKTEFHLWDFPPTKIYVQLREWLTKELFKEAIDKVGDYKNLVRILIENSPKYGIKRRITSRDLHSYEKGKRPHPLWVLKEIATLTSFSLNEVENGVKWYRGPVGTKIYPEIEGRRMLPIRHDVSFEYMFGILFSSYAKPQNGVGVYVKESAGKFAYDASRNVFGNFRVRKFKIFSTTYIYFPLTIYHILKHCHPKTELNEPNENITSFVLGLFTNKGCVGPHSMVIDKKNKELLSHTRELLKIIGCDSTLYEKKTTYELRLNKENSLRFIRLVEGLSDVTFSPYHQNLIEKRIKRRKISCLPKEKRKEQILRLLETPKTMTEVSYELGLSYTQTCRYIKELEKSGSIYPVGKRKRTRIYTKLYKRKNL